MKKLFLFLILLQFSSAVNIHEVFYDPLTSESGGEALVLYSSDLVDISGWFLRTETSDVDLTFPEGTKFKGYYLVTDEGWDDKKDDVSWRSSDYEETITLSNTDAGVALFDEEENLIDSVGWGNEDKIDVGLFSGNPAKKVSSGFSLLRINDSNNNYVDFVQSIPILNGQKQNSNSTQKLINVIIDHVQTTPKINSINLKSDSFIEGGILLIPGVNTSIFVDLNISFPDNSSSPIYINGVEGTNLTINLPYTTLPGVYEVLVETSGIEKIATYEVLPLLALDVDSSNLEFKTGDPVFSIEGDDNFSTTSRPTIMNVGNIPLNLQIVGDDFSYSINGFTGNSISEKTLDISLLPGKTTPLNLSFSIPEEKRYSFSILVVAK